jgi:hypothetical protein
MGETEFHRLVNVTYFCSLCTVFLTIHFYIYQEKGFAALQNLSPVVYLKVIASGTSSSNGRPKTVGVLEYFSRKLIFWLWVAIYTDKAHEIIHCESWTLPTLSYNMSCAWLTAKSMRSLYNKNEVHKFRARMSHH